MAPRRAQKEEPWNSPRSISANLQGDAAVMLQLKQFLDEWYYRILHSSMAKEMSRWEALQALLDVLEMVGVRFSDGEKEEIAALKDEEAVISRIVDCMPQGLRDQWEHVCLQLQTVVHATTRVRKAAEVKGDDADESVSDIFEDANEEGILQQILKGAVVFSSKNVAKLRRVHASWRQSTDARIDRMSRLQGDAENTTQQLLVLESQLAEMGVTSKNKGKTMLLSMAEGNDKTLTHSVFSAWRGLRTIALVEMDIRKKFEDRITEAESQLIQYKAKQIENVRGVLSRLNGEEDEALLRDVWTFWIDEVKCSKGALGENGDELKRVQAMLDDLQQSSMDSVKRVMTRLAGNNAAASMNLCLQAWTEHGRMFKQEKEMENAVKNTEAALKKQLNDKKNETKRILEKLAGSTDTGLMTVMIQHWIEYMHEEKDARAMDEALYGQERKFKTLAQRHRATAKSVRIRVNGQMDLNIKQNIFGTWVLEMRTNGINHAFQTKYGSKKRQLQGVQNLFRSFAVQLEQNLGGDEDEPSAIPSRQLSSTTPSRAPSSKRSSNGKHRDRGKYGSRDEGMSRDNIGASSLPDIHSERQRGYLA